MEQFKDYPKIECPFVRERVKVLESDFKKFKKKYKLRKPEVYLVKDEVRSGYEWVLDDPNTIAVEKLDGTNISIYVDEYGDVNQICNRTNELSTYISISDKSSRFDVLEGLINAFRKKYIKESGIYYGELVGNKVQGNPYDLNSHIWYPFNKAVSSLRYKSFNKFEQSYESLSNWFKTDLNSLFYKKMHKVDFGESPMAEGVVFYNFKRIKEGKVGLAKLRRDMFDWYYEGLV